MHIAIAGNIGSGKTTLTTLLSKHFKWRPQYEDNESNPYLVSFYDDMRRWSFNLQIYFLNTRFRQIQEIRRQTETVIQDRTIYEDGHIFAPNLHAMGLMSTRDYENYRSLFDLMEEFVVPPDLLIYLKAGVPTLIKQIQRKGRDYENSIRLDYITGLNNRYDAWANEYKAGKILVIDIDELDFADNPEDLRTITSMINAEINGLFKEL